MVERFGLDAQRSEPPAIAGMHVVADVAPFGHQRDELAVRTPARVGGALERDGSGAAFEADEDDAAFAVIGLFELEAAIAIGFEAVERDAGQDRHLLHIGLHPAAGEADALAAREIMLELAATAFEQPSLHAGIPPLGEVVALQDLADRCK
jgi:hypothetical protein